MDVIIPQSLCNDGILYQCNKRFKCLRHLKDGKIFVSSHLIIITLLVCENLIYWFTVNVLFNTLGACHFEPYFLNSKVY